MLPYCIPLLYDALPASNNPASYPLSGPGAAIPLPCRKCSKRGFSGTSYPTAHHKPETPLRTSTAPVPGVAADLLSGVSPSGSTLRPLPGQKPRLSKVLPNPIPHCKCSKRGFRFGANHRALLGGETPLSTSEALRLWGWRLAGIAKPQPKNKAGAGDQPGYLGFAHHRDVLNHQRAAIGGDYPQEDLIELLGGFNVNIHLGAVHINAANHIIRQQLVDR